MLKNKKLLISFVAIIIFCVSIFAFSKIQKPIINRAEAQPSAQQLYGSAWSDNIGWISFNNCTDPSDPTTCSSPSYNVKIQPPPDGFLYGSAWSPNVGWIVFDPNSSGPQYGEPAKLNSNGTITGFANVWAYDSLSPSQNYDTETDPTTGNVDDWADGWINFSGVATDTNHSKYSTKIDMTGAGTSSGYAWGSNVTGWIDMSGVKMANSNQPTVTLFITKVNSAPITPTTSRDIHVGDSVELTWTSSNLTTCGGSVTDSTLYWQPTPCISGNQTFTMSNFGNFTFTMTGAVAGSPSIDASVTVNVTIPCDPPNHSCINTDSPLYGQCFSCITPPNIYWNAGNCKCEPYNPNQTHKKPIFKEN